MATIFSHFALGWGAYRLADGRRGPRLGPFVAASLSVLPDADSLLMPWIPYEAPWGHRGVTHSLAFAAVVGVAAAWALKRFGGDRVALGFGPLAALLTAVTASHGVLDAMTDGGHGIAFFAPFDDTRHFLPATPIPVSPITFDPLNPWLWEVLAVESLLLWPAAIAMAVWRRPLHPLARAGVVASLVASAIAWGWRWE